MATPLYQAVSPTHFPVATGIGRTGTGSMRGAIDMLGFGSCNHMFEVNAYEEQKRLWQAMDHDDF